MITKQGINDLIRGIMIEGIINVTSLESTANRIIEALTEENNLIIPDVSVSLPDEDEITEWVCKEFNIDGTDFDEEVRMQNGYLPDVFYKFAKWVYSNEC